MNLATNRLIEHTLIIENAPPKRDPLYAALLGGCVALLCIFLINLPLVIFPFVGQIYNRFVGWCSALVGGMTLLLLGLWASLYKHALGGGISLWDALNSENGPYFWIERTEDLLMLRDMYIAFLCFAVVLVPLAAAYDAIALRRARKAYFEKHLSPKELRNM